MSKQTKVLLRFNTENTGKLHWRVIIGDQELLADNVIIWVPTHTSEDKLPDGRVKHHITCYANKLSWRGKELTIN